MSLTKTRRVELRADAIEAARIRRAAQLRHQTVSAFILQAATREADVLLGPEDVTLMPAAQFDALIAALDVADQAPKLREIAKRPSRFEHK